MSNERENQNRRTTIQLLLIAVGAFGFAFALVPLYDVICEVTGLNGKTNSAPAAVNEVDDAEERLVRVEFVLSKQCQWEFGAPVMAMEVQPGKMYCADLLATNMSLHQQVDAG